MRAKEFIKESLDETPIDDFDLVGNWGDDEKSNSFNDKRDRALLQSPKAVEKIKKSFSDVEVDINMYFVNSPGAGGNAEGGRIKSLDELDDKFKPEIVKELKEKLKTALDDDALNIIYVGNRGFKKIFMTGWIMAHRIGHAFQADRNNHWDHEINPLLHQLFSVVDEAYGLKLKRSAIYDDNSKELTKFFQQIGTMKSARDKNLNGRPYEFVYEMFTQWLLTGSVKFNKLPERFGTTGYRLSDDADLDDLNNALEDVASHANYAFENIMGANVNSIFLM